MSILTPLPAGLPPSARIFYSIPLLGWIARDVAFGAKDNIWYALVILATVWLLSIMAWGYPALIIPYLAAVPVCFFLIIVISRP